MVEKYFIWVFEEYEWCGRTDYKKVVVFINVRRKDALEICKKNGEYNMETMDKLDHTFER